MSTIAARRRLTRLHNRARPYYWLAGFLVLALLGYAMIYLSVQVGGRFAAAHIERSASR